MMEPFMEFLLTRRIAARYKEASGHLLDTPLERPARIETDGSDFDNTWYSLKKGDVPTKALEKILERDFKGPVTIQVHRVHSPIKVDFKVKSTKGDYLIEVVLAEANGRKWKKEAGTLTHMEPGKWYAQELPGGEVIHFHAIEKQKNGKMGGKIVRTWGKRNPKVTKDSIPQNGHNMNLWKEVKESDLPKGVAESVK